VTAQLAGHDGVRTLVAGQLTADGPSPALLQITARQLAEHSGSLMAECFGPTSILVPYRDHGELMAVVAALPGQLTATIHGEPDGPDAGQIVAALADRAGRIAWNGWPTDVSVTWAQHHGGPYLATTSPLHTSVGMASVGRFQRPIAYQNMPDGLLPAVLRRDSE
jgi:NADP-dependent aldehyde dehydrogenase